MDRTYTPREAYEEDCRRMPLYHTGERRPAWSDLSEVVRRTWVRNPTPRWSAAA